MWNGSFCLIRLSPFIFNFLSLRDSITLSNHQGRKESYGKRISRCHNLATIVAERSTVAHQKSSRDGIATRSTAWWTLWYRAYRVDWGGFYFTIKTNQITGDFYCTSPPSRPSIPTTLYTPPTPPSCRRSRNCPLAPVPLATPIRWLGSCSRSLKPKRATWRFPPMLPPPKSSWTWPTVSETKKLLLASH